MCLHSVRRRAPFPELKFLTYTPQQHQSPEGAFFHYGVVVGDFKSWFMRNGPGPQPSRYFYRIFGPLVPLVARFRTRRTVPSQAEAFLPSLMLSGILRTGMTADSFWVSFECSYVKNLVEGVCVFLVDSPEDAADSLFKEIFNSTSGLHRFVVPSHGHQEVNVILTCVTAPSMGFQKVW